MSSKTRQECGGISIKASHVGKGAREWSEDGGDGDGGGSSSTQEFGCGNDLNLEPAIGTERAGLADIDHPGPGGKQTGEREQKEAGVARRHSSRRGHGRRGEEVEQPEQQQDRTSSEPSKAVRV